MGKISLRVSDDLDSFLDFMAKESNMSKSDVVRFAITNFQFRAMIGEYQMIMKSGKVEEYKKMMGEVTENWSTMLSDITEERQSNMRNKDEYKKDKGNEDS